MLRRLIGLVALAVSVSPSLAVAEDAGPTFEVSATQPLRCCGP